MSEQGKQTVACPVCHGTGEIGSTYHQSPNCTVIVTRATRPCPKCQPELDFDRQPMADNNLVTMFQTSLVREILDQVKAERIRQIEGEGFTTAHDDEHAHGELARAAASYAISASYYPSNQGRFTISELWPWDWEWFKPKESRGDLIRAAALLVAEIERLDRNERAAKDGPFPPSYNHCGRS